jgi:hypothetical protein
VQKGGVCKRVCVQKGGVCKRVVADGRHSEQVLRARENLVNRKLYLAF